MIGEEILEILKVTLSEISRPQDLLKYEILQQYNKEQIYPILKNIQNFALEKKDNYNNLIAEKQNRLVDKSISKV